MLTLTQALRQFGIQPYVINGSMSPKAREDEVKAFIKTTEDGRRVLLFSQVGSVGLNLACANSVILYVSVWVVSV